MEGSVGKTNGKRKDRNSLDALEFSCPTASKQENCKKRKRSAPDLTSETKQQPRRIRRHSECTSRATQVSLCGKHITDSFSQSRLKVKPEPRAAFKSTFRDGEMESQIRSFISSLDGDHQYGIPRGGMNICVSCNEEQLHADSGVKTRRVSVGGPVLQRDGRSVKRRNRREKWDFGAPDAVCCVNCPECESALKRRKQSAPELALMGQRHISVEARRQSDFVLGGWSKRDRCRRCRRFRSHSTLVGRGVQSVTPDPAGSLETGGGDAGQLSGGEADVERGSVSVGRTRRLVEAAVAAERRRHSVRLPLVGFLVLLCAFAAFVIAVSVRMTPPARAEPTQVAPKECHPV